MAQLSLLSSKTAAHLQQPTVTQANIRMAKDQFLNALQNAPGLTDGDRALVHAKLVSFTTYLSTLAR